MLHPKLQNLLRWAAALALCAGMIVLAALITRHNAADNGVRINEVLASNSACPAPDGSYPDFIELYNAGAEAVDLTGCGLTDSGRFVKYVFPEGSELPAGGYLVVWCDAHAPKDSAFAAFSVARDGGERLSLLNRHGAVIDSVETLALRKNQSMVRTAEGWEVTERPTPGFENSAAGYTAYLASRSDAVGDVHISELMSSNNLFPLPDGGTGDFIELCNAGDRAAILSGCTLSDREDKVKYVFPAGSVLGAGEYLLLPCGDALGFSLGSAGGETLCFLGADGRVIDRIPTPALEQNCSYALAEGVWQVTAQPTPGFENSAAGYEAYLESLGMEDCDVVISEVMSRNRGCLLDAAGSFSDWIELCNRAPTAQSLDGFWLSDDPAKPRKWRFPDGTVIPAEGYLLVFCDGLDALTDGEVHSSFSLSRNGETLTLSNPIGVTVDRVDVPVLGADRSFADGAVTDAPSPGYPNTAAGALAFLASRTAAGPLVINEVMSANGTYLYQYGGKYCDWVELRNISDQPVLLSDYTMTDDPDAPARFRFPDETLAPGAVCVVLLSGDADFPSEYPLAPFALNAEEDWLYLLGPEGTYADYLHVAGLPPEGSLGRMDGEPGLFYFAVPTPGKPNTGGAREIAAPPEADVAPGVYDGVEALTVALIGPAGAEIRYTTDGSTPGAGSALYTAPFRLEKTSVLRARCFAPGCLGSETASFSYIINEGHDLPVVSLVGNPNDLVGGFGVLAQEHSVGERPVNFSFFGPEGSFSIDCGAALFGQTSRQSPKRSLKLLFRPRYGGNLVYPLFGPDGAQSFASLVLRCGQDYPFSIIREELMTSLCADAGDDVMTQDFRYCVMYVNGRYWGIYALKERLSEEFYAAHRNVSPESVDMVRATRILEPGNNLFSLVTFADQHDLREEANYRYIEENFDLKSLTDWLVFETYCGNSDILNNVRYVRSSEEDGRWRYCFFDLDWSFLEHGNGIRHALEHEHMYCLLPRAVLKNEEYRAFVLGRLAELLAGPLSEEHVLARIDALSGEIRSEVPRERDRWGGNVEAWEKNIQSLKDYVTTPGRVREMIDGYCSYLNVTDEERAQYFSGLYG